MNIQQSKTQLATASFLFLSTQILTGCDNSELRSKVTEFQQSVNTAKASVSTYYLGINDLMRDLYVDSIRYQREPQNGAPIEELHELTENGKTTFETTGLVEYYSKDYIAARLAAMEAISTYTFGLAELITSTSPKDAKEAIVKTGAELNALNAQITKASDNRVEDLSKFTTPIAQLSSIVAEKWLEFSQRRATVESIQKSKEKIQELASQLEQDVNATNKAITGTKASKTLDILIESYNGNQAFVKGSILMSDRNALIDKIKLCAKRKADISQCPTGPFLERLRAIHDRLVEYVSPENKGIKITVKAILTPGDTVGPDLVRHLELLKYESERLKQNTNRIFNH